MIHNYEDDNGATIAKRRYVTEQEREAVIAELLQMAEGKSVEWFDLPPEDKSSSNIFGQTGIIAFVVEVDQSGYLSTLRERLMHLAKTAKTGTEFEDGWRDLCGKVAAYNHKALIEAVDGVSEIFHARFAKSIGRVGEYLSDGPLRFSDFDTIKINAEGAIYQSFGEARRIALKDLVDVKVYGGKA